MVQHFSKVVKNFRKIHMIYKICKRFHIFFCSKSLLNTLGVEQQFRKAHAVKNQRMGNLRCSNEAIAFRNYNSIFNAILGIVSRV